MKLNQAPAAVLALACLLPAPASAQVYSVSTAAWATAGSVCRALGAGLSFPESIRIGMADNRYLWSAEMNDPAFARLAADQIIRQCPDDAIKAHGGRSQL